MYPSVVLDVPPNGQPGIYVAGVYLPVLDAGLDAKGDLVVTIDGDYLAQSRGLYAHLRNRAEPADSD